MSNGEVIQMIPIKKIRVLNPRSRESKRYETIAQSIQNLGLKIPIVVSIRSEEKNGTQKVYDLVCGQGRLEAYIEVGENSIPARVIDVPKNDRLLMSLIENIARRRGRRIELTNEIIRLLKEGYNAAEISKKIDCNPDYIKGLIFLHKAGEQRLLKAVMNESIPYTIALSIAKATTNTDAQAAIMEAYQNKEITGRAIPSLKRLLERRELLGKGHRVREPHRRNTDKDSIVATYRREVDKQKRMTKKAQLCETRLVFIKEAFGRLLRDENFQNLLRAEKMETMPEPLSQLLHSGNEA